MQIRWHFFAAAALFMVGTAHAQVSGNVVKIGVLNDQSGIFSDLSGRASVEAARLAAEDFAKESPDLKVEIVFADHQNKPDVGANIARQWYDQDGVDMIIDLPNSAVALAVNAIAKQKNKAVIYTATATESLTQADCLATSVQYVYDTYALAHVNGAATIKAGGNTWFFVTPDYSGGRALAESLKNVIKAAGGTVLGEVYNPVNTADFSSFLLQAQASKAKIVGVLNAGQDQINAIKQAQEFGLVSGGQKLVGGVTFLSDIHAMGLAVAHGLLMTMSFYWDYDDQTRAWSKRYFERMQKMPNDNQAGIYSAIMHYLTAVKALHTDDPVKVVDWMKANPRNDFFTRGARILPNGRLQKEMYLAEVKAPEESKGPWDYVKILSVVPGDQAFRPISETTCPLVKK
jgi:branched-chain amino acid transport system substrate-binding protein